jgi:hypothetical protein
VLLFGFALFELGDAGARPRLSSASPARIGAFGAIEVVPM